MKVFQFWLIRGKIETGGGQWFVARGRTSCERGDMFRRVRGMNLHLTAVKRTYNGV